MGLLDFIQGNFKIMHKSGSMPTTKSKEGFHFVSMKDRKAIVVVSKGVVHTLWDTENYKTKAETDLVLGDHARSIDVLNLRKADASIVNAIINGYIKKSAVDTYNDTSGGKTSLLSKYPNPLKSWDVLVRKDETKGGKSNRYNWNGEEWIDLETGNYEDRPMTSDISGTQKLSVDDNYTLTLPAGMDLYIGDGNWKRLNKDYTCKLHNGTGRIQYEPVSDTFTNTNEAGLLPNGIVIGTYFAQDVQLFNSTGQVVQYDKDGNVKDILYRSMYDKELLRNMSLGLSSRANVKVAGKTVTIGTGDIYIQMGNGTAITLKITEEFNHTFEKSELIVYNMDDKSIHIRDNSVGSTNKPKYRDIPLFINDGIAGITGGALYQHYINKITRNLPSQITTVLMSRAKITVEDKTVTIGTGEIYIKTSTGGTIILKYTSGYTHTFEENSYIVYNLVDKTTTVKVSSELVSEDIILFAYDSLAGISDGIMFQYFINQQVIKGDINAIPSFVMTEARKTWQRFNDWAGTDKVVLFPIMTDIHSGGNDKYKHIGYVAETGKLFGYSCAVNLGDIGLNVSATNATVQAANDFLDKIAYEHGKFNCPVLFARGNHDYDGGAGTTIPEYRLSNYMQQPSKRKATDNYHINPNTAYGYFDINADKVRIIFTDSCQPIPYGYDKAQLQYLIGLLSNTPVDYTVVILSHRFPDQKGDWLSNGQVVEHEGKVKNEKSFREILKTFVAKSVGSDKDSLGLSWDFSNAKGKLAGVLCGDSHFDTEVKADGVNIICTQGYGGIDATTSLPAHGTVTPFDYSKQLLVDIVAIKPQKGEFKYFRMGAGGESRDRVFTY